MTWQGSNPFDSDYPWRVGEICTCNYQGIAGGLLYIVTEVTPPREEKLANGTKYQADAQLKIKPVYGLFQDIEGRKTRKIGAGWCRPQSLIELSTEYAKLGHFIADLARLRGAE